MAKYENSASWGDEDFMEGTVDPSVSVSVLEEVPTLTVATTAAVAALVLLAIAAVFLLGVFIDWRQQRLLDKQIGEAKKLKNQRRVSMHPENDNARIANNMEEPGLSAPPAELLRTVP